MQYLPNLLEYGDEYSDEFHQNHTRYRSSKFIHKKRVGILTDTQNRFNCLRALKRIFMIKNETEFALQI